MSAPNTALESMAEAILSGKESEATRAVDKALAEGIGIDEIVKGGVLQAWRDFCDWYERDENAAIRSWTDCFMATMDMLKFIESKIEEPREAPFSMLMVTVRGEGHVTMREIIATLLKAKGLKVYTSRKGVLIDDVSEALSDPKLRFVVLSCIETSVVDTVQSFVRGVKEKRKDITVIAGGPMADRSGADIVTSDLDRFGSIVTAAQREAESY
jgi:methanogenic corrinoid protein MtbC1